MATIRDMEAQGGIVEYPMIGVSINTNRCNPDGTIAT
jgi:hypothetical protein